MHGYSFRSPEIERRRVHVDCRCFKGALRQRARGENEYEKDITHVHAKQDAPESHDVGLASQRAMYYYSIG